jgi:hypothetical protein
MCATPKLTAIGGRRLRGRLSENDGEVTGVGKARADGEGRHRQVGTGQKALGAFDVNASDLLGDPSAEDSAKLPLEQTAGYRNVAQEIVNADRPVARGSDPAQSRGDIIISDGQNIR